MIDERDYMRRGQQRGRWPWDSWSAVKLLLIINVVVWVLCNLGENGERFCYFMSLSCDGVRSLQLWKPFTYMFTHVSAWHLFVNLWALWMFGKLVEMAIGKSRMIQLYLFSGLIGAVIWLLFNWHGSPAVCIGASGATFGIMVAAAMAFPTMRVQLIFPPISMKLRTLAIVYCAYEIFAEIGTISNIAHLAHLGGALGAFIFMRRLFAAMPGKNPTAEWLKGIFKRTVPRSRPSTSGDASSQASTGNGLGDLDSDEVDRVLDKLAATGRSSLTPDEKALLEEASRRLRDR